MDIGALQFNTDFQKEIISKAEENKTKDFDAILKEAAASQDDKALREACEELETYMLSQLFKQMKTSMLSGESLIPKGDYEKTFEDYMIDNQSKEMTKAGGIGLADVMYRQMTHTYSKHAKDDTQNTPKIDQEI
jgi:flagellar protein FlgJ